MAAILNNKDLMDCRVVCKKAAGLGDSKTWDQRLFLPLICPFACKRDLSTFPNFHSQLLNPCKSAFFFFLIIFFIPYLPSLLNFHCHFLLQNPRQQPLIPWARFIPSFQSIHHVAAILTLLRIKSLLSAFLRIKLSFTILSLNEQNGSFASQAVEFYFLCQLNVSFPNNVFLWKCMGAHYVFHVESFKTSATFHLQKHMHASACDCSMLEESNSFRQLRHPLFTSAPSLGYPPPTPPPFTWLP